MDLNVRVRVGVGVRVVDLAGDRVGAAVLEVLEGGAVEGGCHGLRFSAAGLHGLGLEVGFEFCAGSDGEGELG